MELTQADFQDYRGDIAIPTEDSTVVVAMASFGVLQTRIHLAIIGADYMADTPSFFHQITGLLHLP